MCTASQHYPSASHPPVWAHPSESTARGYPHSSHDDWRSASTGNFQMSDATFDPYSYDSAGRRVRRRPVPVQNSGRYLQQPGFYQEPTSAPSNVTSFRPRPRSSDSITSYTAVPQQTHYPTQSPYLTHQPAHVYSHSTSSLQQPAGLTLPSPTIRRSQSVFASPDRPTRDIDAFEDVSQFHLFVEATSGLPSFNPFSPTGSTPQTTFPPAGTGFEHSYFPMGAPEPSEIQPRRSSYSFPLAQEQTTLPARQEAVQSLALAEAWQALTDENFDRDDELPDYEQSQREASMAQRREATQRARELERRWRERDRARR